MTDIIAHMLPRLRSHVWKDYRWIADRGNCMLEVEDLIQVACIEMMKLAAQWDEIRERDSIVGDGLGAFFGYLKTQVKTAILQYSKRVTNDQSSYGYPSFDDKLDGAEASDVEVRTSLRIPERFGERIAWGDIVDYFSIQPRRDKIWLALRYFDELPLAQMEQVLGQNMRSGLSRAVERMRACAKAQYASEFIAVPTITTAGWEPPETLVAYLRDRHRCDIDEYLGYVTICFREDVSYLVGMLASRAVVGLTSRTFANSDREARYAVIDQRLDEGRTHQEIADEVGLERSSVSDYAKRRRDRW